ASIKATGVESTVGSSRLTGLCTAALYEALGRTPPSPEELTAREAAARSEARSKQGQVRAKRRELVALLAAGPEGIKAWNGRLKEALGVAPFKKVDLTGKDISGAHLVDMPEGRFAGASLAECDLRDIDLGKADFQTANLKAARADKADLRKASFIDANLE